MDQPQFVNGLFIDDTLLNGMAAVYRQSFEDIGNGLFSEGLISPASLALGYSNLVVNVTAPLPFRVLFGNGVLAAAYGTTDGATNDAYSVDFSSLVPSSGSVTAYLVATAAQIQQTPLVVIGPPKGHPDYNPANAPFQFYSMLQDTLALSATTTAPDNSTTFEIGRTTLSAGQTSITSLDTTNQVQARPLQIVESYNGNPNGHVAGTQGSALAQPSMVWDYAENLLWICTTTGDSATAVWRGQAPLNSPVFSGTPTAPTPAAGDSSTKIANTAYADRAVATEASRAESVEATKAPLASPQFTGTPTVPTPAAGTNNTQAANTAWTKSNFAAYGGTSSNTFYVNSGQNTNEADIGASCGGVNNAYLYNNPTDWGLYSTDGGSIISYTRSGATVKVGGGRPITITAATGSNQAVALGQLTDRSLNPFFNSAQSQGMAAGGSNTVPILYGFANFGSGGNSGTTNNITASASFTTTTKVILIVVANAGTGSANVSGGSISISAGTTIKAAINYSSTSTYADGILLASVNVGTAVTINWNVFATSTSALNAEFIYFCIPTP